jgi:DNA polymerase-3 subunit alpha
LRGVERVLAMTRDCTLGELLADEERPEGAPLTVAGLITEVAHKRSRRGDLWAAFTVEDLQGGVEVLVFQPGYAQLSHLLVADTVVSVKGRLMRRDGVPVIRATDISVPDVSAVSAGPLTLTLVANRCTPVLVDQLKDVLRTHPGLTEVRLRLQEPTRTRVLRLDEGLRVSPGPALTADLKALLGPSCLA